MKKVLIVFLGIFLLFGCANNGSENNGSADLNTSVESDSGNSVPGSQGIEVNQDGESDGQEGNTVETEESDGLGLDDESNVVYCVVDTPATHQTLYFAKDQYVIVTETSNGAYNKIIVDRAKSCTMMPDMPKACSPITASFDDMLNSQKQQAEIMGACQKVEYDPSIFSFEVEAT